MCGWSPKNVNWKGRICKGHGSYKKGYGSYEKGVTELISSVDYFLIHLLKSVCNL